MGMQMLVLVLNKTECLEKLLEVMIQKGIQGATVLDSTGMMRVLSNDSDMIFGVLRQMLNPERKASKTIFVVLRDEQVPTMRAIVRQVTGGLDKPDTGILFSLPVNFVEGLVR